MHWGNPDQHSDEVKDDSRNATWCAVLHTNDVEMGIIFIGEAPYYVTFIDEASGHVSTFHLKTKPEAAKLLKH